MRNQSLSFEPELVGNPRSLLLFDHEDRALGPATAKRDDGEHCQPLAITIGEKRVRLGQRYARR